VNDAWFPCYSNDLLGSMRWKMMSPAQRGGYWQLICWQMQSHDGHLDADPARLSALADVDVAAPANALLLEAFPLNGNGRRANLRALEEWNKRKAISGERSKAGSKGIAKRWQGHSKPITNATTSTSTSTVTSRDTPTATKAGAVKPRARNPLMDALGALEGNLAEIGRSKWACIAKALATIREVAPDVTPDEIARRAGNYASHFDGAALTATALAKHWARCGAEKTNRPNGKSGPAEPQRQYVPEGFVMFPGKRNANEKTEAAQ
jgi:hypothetical protein